MTERETILLNALHDIRRELGGLTLSEIVNGEIRPELIFEIHATVRDAIEQAEEPK